LSLVLTGRFVHDPASFAAERKTVRSPGLNGARGNLNVDALGIALIAVGSGALEVLLDRGQIEDWFSSTLICWLAVIGIGCLIAAVFWELHVPDPVIDFRLLKTRNFAISCVFYFVFGFGLFGTTTMIPQMLQQLYGYRAIDAGLVLGPGAFVITLLAPVGAQLVQRGIVRPKILLFGAIIVVGISMIHYSRMNLQTDYNHYAWARALQGLGYAFFFVPLSVISYSQLRPDQNNRASSLTNFFRNWGGSFGVAFITTMSERRQDFHQARLGNHLSASNLSLQQAIQNTSLYLQSHGFSAAQATQAATLRVYNQLGAQTHLLAFMDCFHIIGIVTLVAAPLVLFTAALKPSTKIPEGH
jgi:DHA2 family multidrug resistance protein